jgi:hypothetical protein
MALSALLRNTLFLLGFTLITTIAHAQIVPDTSLNTQTIPPPVVAEADSLNAVTDTITPVSHRLPFQPQPKRAGLYSTIFPGAGQIYNRQYWKLPIVYAALGVTVYLYLDNREQYRYYRGIYIDRQLGKKDDLVYTTEQILQQQNFYRKNQDIMVLLSGIGYTLQIIDAVASAHLKNFDISRDISMNIAPVAYPGGMGVAMVFRLK